MQNVNGMYNEANNLTTEKYENRLNDNNTDSITIIYLRVHFQIWIWETIDLGYVSKIYLLVYEWLLWYHIKAVLSNY